MSPHRRKRMGPAAIGVACVFGACWTVGCSTVLGIGDWTNLADGGEGDSTGGQKETADGSRSQDAAMSDRSAHPEASKDSSDDGPASIDSSDDAPDTTGDVEAAACSTMCGGNCVDEQTDKTNCGACARSCMNQPCTGGVCTPVVLASGTNVTGSENYLAVDSANGTISWTNYLSGGSVVRMPTTVGATQTVLATNQDFPGDTYSIFAVGGQTFWGTLGAGLWGGPAAMGGAYTEWGPPTAGAPQATGGVCVNLMTAYWIAINGDAFTLYKQNLAVAPSTAPTAVASSTSVSAYYLACDATGLYWAEASSGFWREPYGGAAVEVATAQPSGIAADGLGNVYFTGQSPQLQAMTSAGGNVHTISVTGGLTGPGVVIADSTYVYVDDVGTIKRVPVGGGTPLVIATGSVGFGSMGMDGTYIYFFSSSGLVRTPK